jgi:hypothetical protein
MRMCVDYRAINALTKMEIPTSDINMLLDHRGSSLLTKIDLNQAYYQIRVVEDPKKYTPCSLDGGFMELYEFHE